MTEIIATLSPSPMRRVAGTAAVGLLGTLLIWIAVFTAPSFGWRVGTLLCGALAMWCALALWQATSHRIELTREGLRDTSGRLSLALGEIARIDRSTFAFKPSNGFVVILKRPQPRSWAPGLWWCLGKRVGIGGVTSRHEGKYMAEQLAMKVALRDGEAGQDD